MTHKKNKNSIFDVRIDNLTKKDVDEYIDHFLATNTYHHIVTLNPEILLRARSDQYYKDVLNKSALMITDGIGIKFALWRFGTHLNQRISGVDMMHVILKKVDIISGCVFLATHAHGLSDWRTVKKELQKLYPHIDFIGKNIDPRTMNDFFSQSSVDVILCNFGAPEQEFFLSKTKVSHAKIGIGIGGAFDFVTGIIPRAPSMIRYVGMEWLYRFWHQPWRWKRIYHAVVVFPLLVTFNKNK